MLKKSKVWLFGALKSWTVWFNAVGIPLMIYLNDNVALWQEYAGEHSDIIIVVINILLRFKTNRSLSQR